MNLSVETFAYYKQLGFVAAFAFATLVQIISPHHKNIKDDFRNWRLNLPMGFLNTLLFSLIVGGTVVQLTIFVENNGWGLFQWLQLPFLAQVILTLIVLDLVTYFWHRMNHRVNFLWRYHQVHHSDVNFDTSTAIRFHIGELLISFIVRVVVILSLGITPIALLVFEIIYHILNTFEHGNIRLPAGLEKMLGKIFVTPALHRKHHSKNLKELDTNFATIFSFWDKIFKTHCPSSSTEEYPLGLPQQIKNYSLLELLRLPFAK